MKLLAAALVMSWLSTQVSVAPSDAFLNACLRTESTSPKVPYSPIDVVCFKIIEDGDMGKTVTTLDIGKDTVGIWERKNPPTFGLIFNRKETPLSRVVRLKRDQAPEAFSPYEAVWSVAQDGKKSYICATFNFDGLGKSGSFQIVRRLYLSERSHRESFVSYGGENFREHRVIRRVEGKSKCPLCRARCHLIL